MYPPQGQWRNPYAMKPKKNRMPKVPKPVDVLTTKQDSNSQETKSMKESLLKVREQVKGIREQIVQMESAMDTLYNVMDAMEKFGTSTGPMAVKSHGSLLKTFNNIDFKQVMNLLQSPLVQALLETMAEEEEPKKKK